VLRRLDKARIRPPSDRDLGRLDEYLQLLARWNSKINLTALPLDPPTDEAVDRLIVEPLAAAEHLSGLIGRWIDLGSGGGSPAIPLKVARLKAQLTMVESKARKAAFLREAVRLLGLSNTTVENERIEALADRSTVKAELLTVRGVRLDAALAVAARKLLDPEGRLMVFCTSPPRSSLAQFAHFQTVPLLEGRPSYLAIYRSMFHVEQSR
jgi:16S rRNA (guanine527-N7)-methyltransferase